MSLMLVKSDSMPPTLLANMPNRLRVQVRYRGAMCDGTIVGRIYTSPMLYDVKITDYRGKSIVLKNLPGECIYDI